MGCRSPTISPTHGRCESFPHDVFRLVWCSRAHYPPQGTVASRHVSLEACTPHPIIATCLLTSRGLSVACYERRLRIRHGTKRQVKPADIGRTAVREQGWVMRNEKKKFPAEGNTSGQGGKPVPATPYYRTESAALPTTPR